tara:strand:+ start:69 stop:308 length:240 start_codon:yes stop_codon:yes gene_type:complete
MREEYKKMSELELEKNELKNTIEQLEVLLDKFIDKDNYIKKMVKDFPNNMMLGKEIRAYYIKHGLYADNDNSQLSLFDE